MGILFIGIGLLIGIYVWIERTKTFHEWADYQERLHFEREQEEWRRIAGRYFF